MHWSKSRYNVPTMQVEQVCNTEGVELETHTQGQCCRISVSYCLRKLNWSDSRPLLDVGESMQHYSSILSPFHFRRGYCDLVFSHWSFWRSWCFAGFVANGRKLSRSKPLYGFSRSLDLWQRE